MEFKYDSLEMTGMWGNALPKGNAHAPHTHSNHLFSGVYYIQSDELSSPIQFFDPRPHAHVMRPDKNVDNTLNSDIIAIPCTTGIGIIFPSWLTHWVPPTGSERVSVSWNFIIRGKYGEPIVCKMLISKINEVYLNLKVDEDLERELTDYFTFEVPQSQSSCLIIVKNFGMVR